MMEVGRLCLKIAGRDAGKKCVVVDVIDNSFVMIDGETRRRKCNIAHVEPLKETVDLKKGASHADVVKAFEKVGITVRSTKPKKAAARPRQIRAEQKKKMAEQVEKKPKKEVKKEAPKPKAEPKPVAEKVEEKKE